MLTPAPVSVRWQAEAVSSCQTVVTGPCDLNVHAGSTPGALGGQAGAAIAKKYKANLPLPSAPSYICRGYVFQFAGPSGT